MGRTRAAIRPGGRVAHDFEVRRRLMVRDLAVRYGIRDRRVLEALEKVPRHLFVQPHLRLQAYADHALPIGHEQTISQPGVVARMSEILEVDAEHSVLEIGTGTGYQTAVLALLARRVYSLEIVPELAREAIQRIKGLELDNVKIQAFDGSIGWSDAAPFDRILVTAGAPSAPEPLLRQLRAGGRMVIPEGSRSQQHLWIYDLDGEGEVRRRRAEPVAFVPLLGRHGWQEGE